MSHEPLATPAEELRALSHALRRHVERRQVLGERPPKFDRGFHGGFEER